MKNKQVQVIKISQQKQFDQYAQSYPSELRLGFQRSEQESNDYSNSIEFYDAIPKYVWRKARRDRSNQSKEILPVIKRSFKYQNNTYKLTIRPAVIEGKDGKWKDCYPSKREEIIEDVLRKLACEKGVFLDDQAGVTFTLYEVRQELEKVGHGYNIIDIKEALHILAYTNLEISTEDGKKILISNIVQSLGLQSQEDWKKDGNKTKCFVVFNPFISLAIKTGNFRRINYIRSMSFKSTIARQLYKRMCHNFIQASKKHKIYTIKLSTMIRDFALGETLEGKTAEIRYILKEVIVALKESKENNHIESYEVEIIANNKITDAKFFLTVSDNFIKDIKTANEIKKHLSTKFHQFHSANFSLT
jgi:hypothetical protein